MDFKEYLDRSLASLGREKTFQESVAEMRAATASRAVDLWVAQHAGHGVTVKGVNEFEAELLCAECRETVFFGPQTFRIG